MSTAQAPPRLGAGDLLVIEPQDYCYGSKALRLRVGHGSGGVVPEGAEWVPMLGTEVGPDGTDVGLRYAVVRVRCLADALTAGRTWLAGRRARGPQSGT